MSTNGHTPERRVALVTGGARGIGRAICEALAGDGCAVAIADLRTDQALYTAGELGGSGFDVIGVSVDVADSSSVAACVERVLARFERVDVLVNCAGWDDLMPFVNTDEPFWDRVIEINYKGPLRFAHLLVPGMSERGWGRVVNIGSDAGRVGSSLESIYSGAKGGLIAFSKTLARELAGRGVTVNTVCPGPTDTPFLQEVVRSRGDADKVISAMVAGVPMKRLARPAEVAAAVRFFASVEAGYITGQTLSVSGGLTMA
jgi:2-hydroxycyclohexanecarboxyl-CoA dehydrogenase